MNLPNNSTRKPDRAIYLEASPYEADGGHLIGKLPAKISSSDLRGLGLPNAPAKAIRAKCLDCCAGSPAEVRKCVSVECPLWPMRMGVNPFHAAARRSENKPANSEGF